MKTILYGFLLVATFAFAGGGNAREHRSPMADAASTKVSETTASGLTITVNYSPAMLNGRTIGKDVAPFGQVWNTGASGITIFEISRSVKIEGKTLAAGKYSLYSVPGEEWTLIFNKALTPAAKYSETADALRVTVRSGTTENLFEKITFSINKEGMVNLWWGNTEVRFMVQ